MRSLLLFHIPLFDPQCGQLENGKLAERNAKLTERVADLEMSIRRLWQRGGVAAPSPRELRTMMADRQAALVRAEAEAEAARQAASTNLHSALVARSDAFATMSALHAANVTLEDEKSAAREWHTQDAQGLSRVMASLRASLAQEQHKVALLSADLERVEAERSADVGRLLAEEHAARATERRAAASQQQHAAGLAASLAAAQAEVVEARAQCEAQGAQLRAEIARHVEMLDRSRELAAGNAVSLTSRVSHLTTQLSQVRTALLIAKGARRAENCAAWRWWW